MTVHRTRRSQKKQKRFRLHALGIHPFCRWCQCPLTADSATTDHIVPLSRGGNNDWTNLCLACWDCNQKRKNYLPDEAPSEPAWPGKRRAKGRPPWVAWTRYPGGRWRSTFPGSCPAKMRARAQQMVGTIAETVILPRGMEPAEALLQVWVI